MLTKAETHQMDLGANQEDSQKAEGLRFAKSRRPAAKKNLVTEIPL
jgi:hypothetical protein